ncbi:6940_t:CDS:1 [Paraglomus occultum]|uniref:6940_t:CDS:1 n=1 Tax=Paraglomus occultum TaxID=144539 RepID=A0A9N8Z5L7_9GLOM|nr:6940_t:CDS:1 [Paraglomus occultum]
MNRLPPELLITIFQTFRNDQNTLSALTLTCRRIRLFTLPLLYLRPRFASISAFHSFLSIPASSGALVREIDLSHIKTRWRHITDNDIGMLVMLCPNLISLDINACLMLTDWSLRMIAERIGHKLLQLNITHCKRFSQSALVELASVCENLNSLDFSYTEISESALGEIEQTCKSIKWLNLKYCEWVIEGFVGLEGGGKNQV